MGNKDYETYWKPLLEQTLITREKARDAFLGYDREDVDLIQGEVVENELEN